MTERVRFPDISPRAWEHPADRTALTGLRSLSGFDVLLKTLSGLLRERSRRLLYLASSVRVDERQFRGVNAIYGEAVEVLDAIRPELYVVSHPVPNAMTMGMDRPFVVVSTAMLDLLDDEELRFTLGHEIGHARSGHAVYATMLVHLSRLITHLGWMPGPGWALRAIRAALAEWYRKSELSADRAGLLACQDADAAQRVMMKLAGGARLDDMDAEAFLAQARDYDAAGDVRDGVLKLLNLEGQAHPFAVLRAAELDKWRGSPQYARILAGEYPRVGQDRGSVHEDAREAAGSYRENFDLSADPLIQKVRDLGGGVAGVAGGVRDRVSGWVRGGRATTTTTEDDRPEGR